MSVVSCRFYPVSNVRRFFLLVSFFLSLVLLMAFPCGQSAYQPRVLSGRAFRGARHLAAIANANQRYIKNFPLMELLCCTMCITSAKRGAQLTTFILLDSFFNGIESVTINSNNLEFSIFS